jgi:hypothetical protein
VQNSSTLYNARTIDFPVLTSIGGNVSLSGRTNQAPPTTPTGLHAVTSVGGDIDIRLYGANPNVFSSLTHLDGNLTIRGWTSTGNLDISGGATLAALTSVGGNVRVSSFYSTLNMLNALETVGGNLTLERLRLYAGPSFQSLESVQGNLHFVRMTQFGGLWPALSSVGGELGIIDQTLTDDLSDVLSLGAVSVHALRLENNTVLDNLDGTFQVGAGNIEIHANPLLSQCEVNDFLASQQAGGWSGVASVSGTLACP